MPIAAQSLRLGPWRDGVNYSLPAEEVSPAGLYDMENCTVGLAGEVKKRKGYAKFQRQRHEQRRYRHRLGSGRPRWRREGVCLLRR